jgi:hypothetical protein
MSGRIGVGLEYEACNEYASVNVRIKIVARKERVSLKLMDLYSKRVMVRVKKFCFKVARTLSLTLTRTPTKSDTLTAKVRS